MADILWDKLRNPTPYVSERLGIEEWELRNAIHTIKKRSGLSGADLFSSTQTGRSPMRTATTLGMSSTRSETRKTYATFRVSGDRLDPEQVTRVLRHVPTVAYAKGEKYFAGQRTGYLTGRTGVWLVSTRDIVASDNLHDHLLYVIGMLIPGRQNIMPLAHLRALIARKGLRAELSAFWHGTHGAKKPAIPRAVTEVMKLLPGEIEADFDTDHGEDELQRA